MRRVPSGLSPMRIERRPYYIGAAVKRRWVPPEGRRWLRTCECLRRRLRDTVSKHLVSVLVCDQLYFTCYRSLGLMTAPHLSRTHSRPRPEPYGDPKPAAFIQITPSLASPTRVAPRNANTASTYLSFDSKSLTDVLLGLALACLTRTPSYS